MLGEVVGETNYAKHGADMPGKFSAETLHALTSDPEAPPANLTEIGETAIANANAEMNKLASEREKNLAKGTAEPSDSDGFLIPDDPLIDE